MKKKGIKAKLPQTKIEPWRRFYMSEDEVIMTPAPKPKNSETLQKNRQSDK